jgi:D-alanyl-D-alanine carboxypeptidase
MRVEVASLTKIMTAYTAIKLLKEFKMDSSKSIVTITDVASEIDGTTANLSEGDELTVHDLLFGLLLPSGNDAAFAIA